MKAPPLISMSLKRCKELWPNNACEKVEHWNQYGRGGLGVRQDLFGFADIFCDGPDGTYYIQVTTKNCLLQRFKKITGRDTRDEEPTDVKQYRGECVKSVLGGSGRIFVWAWHQPDGKGTRWVLEEREVKPVDCVWDSGGGGDPNESNSDDDL